MFVKTIDIHGANAHNAYSKTRVACRGIVVRDAHVLTSHEVNTDTYMIPGGGLEEKSGLYLREYTALTEYLKLS